MNPERFKRIDQLFQRALGEPPNSVESFLREACAGDEDLQREVESLIEHERQAGSLLRSPLPSSSSKEQPSAENFAGRTLSHYRLVEKIGEGGMGVVYRAEDRHLKRSVAIKLLPPDRVSDPGRKRRFVKEARAASALNHPNIITIHDIDQAEGVNFIVMEYVAGDTLSRQIPAGGLPVGRVLELAVQMADAFDAAHSAGIIHRDLKPSNVMVTESGQVKILDFGLAKLVEPSESNGDGEPSDLTTSTPGTDKGTILGTLAYMSPEQAHGKKLDARSDIFSFGAVLYEMVSGRRAFQGDSAAATLAMIIRDEPAPLSELVPHVPAGLERVVHRCLRKEADTRFQSMSEVTVELQAVKGQAELRRNAFQPRRRTPAIQNRPLRWVAKIGAMAVVPALLVVLVGWWVLSRPEPLPEFSSFSVTTAAGWEGQPAFAPDGWRIVYASNETGNLDIFVTDCRLGSPQNLTEHPAQDEFPAWFPDGSAIVFASDRNGKTGIWKMTQLGRDETLLVPSGSQPAVSPDGRHLAFVAPGRGGYSRIAIAPLADLTQMRLLTDDEDGLFDHKDPVWSVDGRSIVYSSRHNLWSVPATGGNATPVTVDDELDIEPCWSPRGRFIYFTSYRGTTIAVWRKAIGRSKAEIVTSGTGNERQPSISPDGQRLAYSIGDPETTLVLRDRSSGKEWELSRVAYDQMATLSPDNRSVAIVSFRWRSDPRLGLLPLNEKGPAGPPRLLIDQEGTPSQPRFSHDGKWVAYYQIQGASRDIWITSVSGDPPVRITDAPASDVLPAWSPDDSQLAFTSDRDGPLGIWVIPVRNGRAMGSARKLGVPEVTAAYAPDWSPDGSRLAFVGVRDNSTEVWVAPSDGTGPAEQVTGGAEATRVRWDRATGGWLVSGLWHESQLSIKSIRSPRAPPVGLTPPLILGSDKAAGYFDLSYDASLLVFARQAMKGDIWVSEATEGSF